MNDTPQSPPIKGLGKLIHIAGMGYPVLLPPFSSRGGVASHVRGLFPEHHRAAFLHARLLLELRVAGEAVFV